MEGQPSKGQNKTPISPQNASQEQRQGGVSKMTAAQKKAENFALAQKTRKAPEKTKPEKGLYEIRTMQHDLDLSKGKAVSTVSLTEEKLFKNKKKDSGNALSINDYKEPAQNAAFHDSSGNGDKEGIIGKAEQATKEPSEKVSLISRLKILFARKKSLEEPKKKFSLVISLILLVFIGGIGYYLYNSGALNSLSGISEMFQDWLGFGKEDSLPPNMPDSSPSSATSTASTSTIPLPVPTSTPTELIQISESFFEADDEIIIKLEKLDDFYKEIKQVSNLPIAKDQFIRVGVVAKNSFSSLSLAQAWKFVKNIVSGKEYTELISTEVVENWGLAMPNEIYNSISRDYNIFFYGQPESGDVRAVLIFKLNNLNSIQEKLLLWEETMLFDLKNIFLGRQYGEASTETFQDNFYKDTVHIRYLNLPQPDLTLDHSVIDDYLVITTSREAIWATMDKFLALPDINLKFLEKDTLKESEIISAFQKKYPERSYDQGEVSIEIDQVKGDFALGTILYNNTQELLSWFAVQQERGWEIIAETKEVVTCQELENYQFPLEMIFECYDIEKNRLIRYAD